MSDLEHPHIVAGPFRTARDGQCTWIYHYSGVWLHCCEETAIPGGNPQLCPDHLVEWQTHPDRVEPRRFPPTVVNLEDTK